jgi:hypothetical protein
MGQRVTVLCEVKSREGWSRSESESKKGKEYNAVDPKPGDLSMARVKSR